MFFVCVECLRQFFKVLSTESVVIIRDECDVRKLIMSFIQ